ncbi:hypothetical protein [Myxococcus sp. RHSTA-1-4]|uniref:hypothetical protein n=1 Tax=Myxococcus sp. RHSTA-1-4 TaxID=2874601 RepID=UPI001CBE80A5|nr:hypothetical protein [Myxococcus sp. RHSTA-1-4]MBZ4417511.1 hypothetical protein [Myxococcus sp. RHSTA-1-4]
MTSPFLLRAVGVLLLVALAGCTQRRGLVITEWFPEVVELYLDEPASETLDLSPFSIQVRARQDLNPNVDEPDYANQAGLLGTMSGGSYLVIFEEFGYSGPPVSSTYTDPVTARQVPGIKVAEGFFGWNLGGASTSLRISGVTRGPGGIAGLFHVRQSVDDVLLLGGRPRPSIGGDFTEDTPSPVPLPLAPQTMGRKWGPGGPLDNDVESDWRAGPRTFGEPSR